MKRLLVTAATLASLAFSSSAFALDGCKVLLCLAGNWKGIAACVPPVREALRDMALGHAYPHCDMGSGPSTAPPDPAHPEANRADSYPTNEETCPVMYSRYSRNGEWHSCRYQGLISVVVQGSEWTRVFWDANGATSTSYSPAALAQLGDNVDPTYANDLARCGPCEPPKLTGPEH
jgi:hypothetical protein